MAMEGLIKTLPAVVRASGNAPEVIEAAAIAAWKHAAGEHLKEHTVPICLQDRVLKIAVADAIWQRQLHRMRGQMLFRVNSLLGQPLVGAIEFIIDSRLCR
jgi:predicted nucleic acid-binding Zn ribbon protein